MNGASKVTGGKSLAVMQPYVFPYLGYFHLVESSDDFVFYDDVNFIKKGWINRNRILLGNNLFTFVVPVKAASQNVLIKDVALHEFDEFRDAFLKKIHHGYHKARYYQSGMAYVEQVLEKDFLTINHLAIASVTELYAWLGKEKNFHCSSVSFAQSAGIGRNERIYHIVKEIDAMYYHNMPGGKELYDKTEFSAREIELKFIVPELVPYRHSQCINFHPGLSIIDVVMNNAQDKINQLLQCYRLE